MTRSKSMALVGQGKTGRKPGKKGKSHVLSFNTYNMRLLKAIEPTATLSKESKHVMDSLIHDFMLRLADETQSLLRETNKKTLTRREVDASIRLVLGKELAHYARKEGVRACTMFKAAKEDAAAKASKANTKA